MASQSFEFAGVTTKLTKHGYVRKPALVKMLRASGVRLVVRQKTTDDSYDDAATGFAKGETRDPVKQAREIAKDGSGWWAEPGPNGTVRLGCHSFLSLTLEMAPEGWSFDAYQARGQAAAARARFEAKNEEMREAGRRAEAADAKAREAAEAAHVTRLRLAQVEAELYRREGGEMH